MKPSIVITPAIDIVIRWVLDVFCVYPWSSFVLIVLAFFRSDFHSATSAEMLGLFIDPCPATTHASPPALE